MQKGDNAAVGCPPILFLSTRSIGWQLPRQEVKDRSISFCFPKVRKLWVPPLLQTQFHRHGHTNVLKADFWSQNLHACLLSWQAGTEWLVLVLGGWHHQGHLVDLKLQTVDLELHRHDVMNQRPSRLSCQSVTWGVFEDITKELHREIVKQYSWPSNKTSTHYIITLQWISRIRGYIHIRLWKWTAFQAFVRSIIYVHVFKQALSPRQKKKCKMAFTSVGFFGVLSVAATRSSKSKPFKTSFSCKIQRVADISKVESVSGGMTFHPGAAGFIGSMCVC